LEEQDKINDAFDGLKTPRDKKSINKARFLKRKHGLQNNLKSILA